MFKFFAPIAVSVSLAGCKSSSSPTICDQITVTDGATPAVTILTAQAQIDGKIMTWKSASCGSGAAVAALKQSDLDIVNADIVPVDSITCSTVVTPTAAAATTLCAKFPLASCAVVPVADN